MKIDKKSLYISVIALLVVILGFAQQNNPERILFGKSFVFERIIGFDGCEKESSSSNKSVFRLEMEIDSDGKVYGHFGFVFCVESESPYGEISGFAKNNKVFVNYRFFEMGSGLTVALEITVLNNKVNIITRKDLFEIDDSFKEFGNEYTYELFNTSNNFDSLIKDPLIQVKPVPKGLRIDGSSQESFDRSSEILLENMSIERQENLKEAIFMLLLNGTGSIDDGKEKKWESIRMQLHGMTGVDILEYIAKKGMNNYDD